MGTKKILLILIILIALFLRLHNLDYMEFKKDEAIYSFKASRMVENGVIPLTSGVSSVGINEPPLFVYLLSVPFLISKNPVIASGYIAILNVLAIFICFFVVKDLFDEKAGLIACAFYAVNPWGVFFSRKIWFPELLPFFIMLFVFFIYKSIFQGKNIYLIYSIIVLGFISQLHFTAFYFAIIFIVIIIRYWKKICWKYLMIGTAFFILIATPYTVYQFKNNFTDIVKLRKLTDRENRFNKDTFSTILKLSTTNGFEASFGNDYQSFENEIFKINLFDTLQMLALVSAFIYFIVNYNSKLFILLLWLLFGTLSLVFTKVTLANHYFLHLLPLIFIVLGNLFRWLLESKLKTVRYGVSTYVLVLLIYQFYFSFSLISFAKNQHCINGDYGPPFSYRVAGVRKAMDEGKKNVDDIQAYCKCVKCDRAATMYIIRYLN